MTEALRSTIINTLVKYPSVPEEVRDYVADSAAGLIEDIKDMDANSIASEMFDSVNPLLEGSISEEAVKDLCKQVARAFKGFDNLQPTQIASEDITLVSDYIVDCQSIILAYAGKSLLRSTSLLLKRGCCYGIVGQNGVGKTTLLNRIAAGDIAGFPRDVRVVYVQHEILANDEHTVLDYLRGLAANEGAAGADITRVLANMGFSDEMQQKLVR
jgi:translation initiation factor RLI1